MNFFLPLRTSDVEDKKKEKERNKIIHDAYENRKTSVGKRMNNLIYIYIILVH